MIVFNHEECVTKPRADMFLPNSLKGLGIFLDIVAIALGIVAIITQLWGLFLGTAGCGILGIAAYLCWKNQTICILDENRFEYTTFLGKKTIYYFTDITALRVNSDSFTLFVGNGKVHIESMAMISQKLLDKINAALEKNSSEKK